MGRRAHPRRAPKGRHSRRQAHRAEVHAFGATAPAFGPELGDVLAQSPAPDLGVRLPPGVRYLVPAALCLLHPTSGISQGRRRARVPQDRERSGDGKPELGPGRAAAPRCDRVRRRPPLGHEGLDDACSSAEGERLLQTLARQRAAGVSRPHRPARRTSPARDPPRVHAPLQRSPDSPRHRSAHSGRVHDRRGRARRGDRASRAERAPSRYQRAA